MGLVGQHVVPLQGYEVAEPYCGQRDKTVVKRIDIRPVLEVGKNGRARREDDGGEVHGDEDEVGLRDLGVLHPEAFPDVLHQEGDEGVEALPHALEHDDTQGDARQGVEHAEHLPSNRLWGAVSVA